MIVTTFHVSPGDQLPIYRQIEAQVVQAIAGGRLVAGDQMPSHRELAEELVIAPLTVKKAYDELEASGYLETQRGRGTFVAGKRAAAAEKRARARLDDLARQIAREAHMCGLTLDATTGLVALAHQRISAERAGVITDSTSKGPAR